MSFVSGVLGWDFVVENLGAALFSGLGWISLMTGSISLLDQPLPDQSKAWKLSSGLGQSGSWQTLTLDGFFIGSQSTVVFPEQLTFLQREPGPQLTEHWDQAVWLQAEGQWAWAWQEVVFSGRVM